MQDNMPAASAAHIALLADFGRYVGLEDLSFDEAGECILSFDDIVLRFSHRADRDELVIAAAVMDVPQHAASEFFASLLHLNAALAQHGEGMLGVEPGGETVLWFKHQPMQDLTQQTFQDLVQEIVNRAETWRKGGGMFQLIGKKNGGDEALPVDGSFVRV